jgi:cytoskeletal protein CcmA (bactofilin family)
MFGRKKRASIEVTKITSLVARDMTVQGDVLFEGGLRVDGRVEGNVLGRDNSPGLLVLSEHGAIAGRVKVYDAVINGAVEGDLEVEHFLELQAGARVSGNITYRQLQMDCGATVHGRLERLDAPAAEPPPKVVALISAPKTHPGTS